MLRIPCPTCGIRDELEFRFGGERIDRRPPAECSDTEWGQYLFTRRNVKGEHAELWFHEQGCGRWFEILRDTRTHEISPSASEVRQELSTDRDT